MSLTSVYLRTEFRATVRLEAVGTKRYLLDDIWKRIPSGLFVCEAYGRDGQNDIIWAGSSGIVPHSISVFARLKWLPGLGCYAGCTYENARELPDPKPDFSYLFGDGKRKPIDAGRWYHKAKGTVTILENGDDWIQVTN